MKRYRILAGLLILFLIAGCSNRQNSAQSGNLLPAADGTPETVLLTDPAQIEKERQSLWIAPQVPGGVWPTGYLPKGMNWAEGVIDHEVVLGLVEQAPPDAVLMTQSIWHYAVVAPVWSAREDVSFADLQSAWVGKPYGSTRQLRTLVVYQSDYHAIDWLLSGGENATLSTEFVTALEDNAANLAGQVNFDAWGIIPVNKLNQDLKIIKIDGLSPLEEAPAELPYRLQAAVALFAPAATTEVLPSGMFDDLLATFTTGYPGGVQPQMQQPPTETMVPTSTANPGLPAERTRQLDGMVEIFIPAGEFLMGCDPAHNDGFECHSDELPLHEVFLSDYYIDKYEVNNAQYALCVDAGVCADPYFTYSETRDLYFGNPQYDDYPAVNISWSEANTYCQWVGGDLPTEAQWSKAARGTSLQTYPWGDESPTCAYANAQEGATSAPCVGDTIKVGSRPDGASPYGVLDMAGNVWEWVRDWYSRDYYWNSPYEDPTGPETGTYKIVKGGSWDYSWSRLRIAYNSDHEPESHKNSFGFRCVTPAIP